MSESKDHRNESLTFKCGTEQISSTAGASVDRLRLLEFDYTYSPGGDVSSE